MSITMCHYMKSVKKSRKNKNVHLKTPCTVSTDKRQRNFEEAECSFTSLGLFDALPREMRFGIFGFTLPADLGQLSLTSRKFRDEIMEYIHNNEALLIIVPHIHAKREKGSSEIFITMETEYCCSHFKQLGKWHLINISDQVFPSCSLRKNLRSCVQLYFLVEDTTK